MKKKVSIKSCLSILSILFIAACMAKSQNSPTDTNFYLDQQTTIAPIDQEIPNVAVTPLFFLFGPIFDPTTKVWGINFFDIDQDLGYDADIDDSNGKTLNAFCDHTGGNGNDWGTNSDGMPFNTIDGHRGIDFYVPDGTLLQSPIDGTIRLDNDNFILWILSTDGNYQITFAHIKANSYFDGDVIHSGDVIGSVDSSVLSGRFSDKVGNIYQEFHFGVMKKNSSMSNGWQSIDPFWGPCSNDGNPLGYSLFQESALPKNLNQFIDWLKSQN